MHRTPQLRPLVFALFAAGAVNACQANAPQAVTATAEAPAAITQPPPASQAEKDHAILQYAQMQLMKSFGKRCNWLGSIEQTAIDASLREREAWLQWQGGDLAKAKETATELEHKTSSIACDSGEGRQNQLDIGAAAWQMRSSWALRGYALLPGKDQPQWFEGKSTLAQHRPALETVVAELKGINGGTAEASLEMFRRMAGPLLVVRCKSQDTACPAAALDPAYRTYAEQVVQQAEAYAAALEGIADKTGRPPEPRK